MAIPENDPIVVAPTPTPFDSDDSVHFQALERNIERWLETPLSGFVLTTANGEELALSEEEKVEIVETVNRVNADRRLIIAGIDNPSQSETLRLAGRYAEAGADLVRLRVPRELPPEAIEQYFESFTSRSPVPVVVIHQTFSNAPAAPPEVLGAICEYDNVFGYITDVDIRFENYVRALVPQDRRFWTCNGGLLAYGMLMGANGACMWLGNVAPALCTEIVQLGHDERFAETRPLQAVASRIDGTVIKHGLAAVKVALDILGFEGMRPRSPGQSVSAEAREEIRGVLIDAGLTS